MFNRIRNWFRNRRIKKARQAWVKALRSGKYEQGKHRLCVGGTYCCLGVACEAYIANGGRLERSTDSVVKYGCEIMHLPVEVAEWLDVTPHGGLKEPVRNSRDLIGCNDDGELTFDEIADVIESGKVKSWSQTNA